MDFRMNNLPLKAQAKRPYCSSLVTVSGSARKAEGIFVSETCCDRVHVQRLIAS